MVGSGPAPSCAQLRINKRRVYILAGDVSLKTDRKVMTTIRDNGSRKSDSNVQQKRGMKITTHRSFW